MCRLIVWRLVEFFSWSFGIVLFEMYSLGEIPFETVEPIELIPHLVQGNRPKPPLMAPEKMYVLSISINRVSF